MTGRKLANPSAPPNDRDPCAPDTSNIVEAAHPPLCVRVPIAARMIGVGLTKMYELIGTGEVEMIKLGRVSLIPVASLEALIARHKG